MASDNHSDSQETNSSSVVTDSLNISFEDISYTVKQGFFRREPKSILRGLSGSFNPGELSVIMGQSGAGKSTLMDILTGYTNPTTGTVFTNGRIRKLKYFRRRSAYIQQDDKMLGMLTVRESLSIAAKLKLGNHVSEELKEKRVEEIITSLDLVTSRNTWADRLSGGQRKRLAIGVELVSDPSVIFLDEPTSGLDSSTCNQLICLLRMLAIQGRTIVVTLHQPSASLLEMVDRLYVVVGGQCAYMGHVNMLRLYLEGINLICPPYHNPVDFLIETSDENANSLMQHSGNGSSVDWVTDTSETDRKLDYVTLNSRYNDKVLTSLPPPATDPTSKILLTIKNTYPTSFWKQFTTLTYRSLLSSWRNPSFTLMIVGIHCAMALVVGTLFYNVTSDASTVRDNFNFLYYSLMFLMFTAFSMVTTTFPEQVPMVRREYFNRWYMTGAYYSSTVVSMLPIQTICTLSYGFIVFYMTGQPAGEGLIVLWSFCAIILAVSFVALTIGLFNGSLFDVKHGVVIGPYFIMPFTIFSGFFLRYKDAPGLLSWMFEFSFLKHGFLGLVMVIFNGYDNTRLPCSKEYCHYKYPRQLLIDEKMADGSFVVIYAALLAKASLFIIISYVILKIRLRNKW